MTITQASSEHSICVALRKEDAKKEKLIEKEFLSEIQLKRLIQLNSKRTW